MPIHREFLGWDEPFLHLAVRYLVGAAKDSRNLDLHRLTAVVPGARAGRRLLTLLTIEAERRDALLIPPTILTVGALPESLIERDAASPEPISPLHATLILAELLRSGDVPEIETILPKPPDTGDRLAWFGIAKTLHTLFSTVAGGDLDCEVIAKKLDEGGGFSDSERWEVLHLIYTRYIERLEADGIIDQNLFRKNALEGKRLHAKEIVLAATSDLPALTRRFLVESGSNITALIHAPQALAGGFDEFGCVEEQFWSSYVLELSEEQIIRAKNSRDQAVATTRIVAERSSQFTPQDITVGILEVGVGPPVREEFLKYGVETRDAAGTPLSLSGPLQLLKQLRDFISGQRFSALAVLARHPDIERWLLAQGVAASYIGEMDEFYFDRVPEFAEIKETQGSVRAVLSCLKDLCGELWWNKASDVATIVEALNSVLGKIYPEQDLTEDTAVNRPIVAAHDRISEISQELKLFPHLDTIKPSETIGFIASVLGSESAEPPYNTNAVEMLGWLELHLDDNPVLVLTSANEGFLPESVNSDQWLPNRTRTLLGLTDNARRYARDLAALSAMVHSRESISFIVSDRGEGDEPLLPSRLLLTGPISGRLERVARLYGEGADEIVENDDKNRVLSSVVFPPKPPIFDALPISTMSVTAFGDYLRCPYRFYLKHILKLESCDDRDEELSARHIGTLVHAVLQKFALSGDQLKATDRAEDIQTFLDQQLNALVTDRFGTRISKLIALQVEQLRSRLNAFAVWQAERNAQGWRIHATELEFDEKTLSFPTSRGPIGVRGRIDRIDCHPETRAVEVIDFKVSDFEKDPKETRSKKWGWFDLQLPLYAKVVQQLKISDQPALAFLPIHGGEAISLAPAKWGVEDLEDAHRTAGAIAEKIAQGEFWPPLELPFGAGDEFSWICEVAQQKRRAG